MPRPRSTVPTYCHHRTSDRAFVKIDGRFTFLGKYNSPESHERYARLCREYKTGGPAAAIQQARPADGPVTVAQVLAGFLTYARTAYAPEIDARGREGRSEAENYKHALKPVAKLYASLPATEFGPKALRACRDEMVAGKLALSVINRRVKRIQRVFSWAVSEEMIPGEVIHRLQTVEPLRHGTPGTRSTDKVMPAAQADIDAAIPFMPRRVAAMVKLQLLTGMRSGNVCTIRTCEIHDRDQPVWVYRPAKHKTAHHGHQLEIRIGPKAQAVLRPFLRLDIAAFIFSPAEGEAERREAASKTRKTPLNQGNKPGHAKGTKRVIADRYCPRSYAQAVARAVTVANRWARGGRICGDDEILVRHWHPHQLRHNRATEVRKALGLDAVQAALGQKTANIAAMYAEIDADKASRVATELG